MLDASFSVGFLIELFYIFITFYILKIWSLVFETISEITYSIYSWFLYNIVNNLFPQDIDYI